jgi:hypothetical protein
MSDRSSMRPKKGDLFVCFNDGENQIKILIPKDKATPEKRKIIQDAMTATAKALFPRAPGAEP